MKQDFNKVTATIYSIENQQHATTCKRLIKIFGEKYGAEGHEFYHNLKGILFATLYLKLNN